MVKVLYLAYDGMLDPLGQSQVLPYLKGLSKRGHRIDILSFEKREKMAETVSVSGLRADLEAAGIGWVPLVYHKRLSALATFWDNTRAVAKGWRMAKRADLLHLRSYALGPASLVLSKLATRPLLFDMRGLWVQERIDGGIWSAKTWLGAPARRIERWLLRRAERVVTLTKASVTQVKELGGIDVEKITVIPTCVDLDRFRVSERQTSRSRLEFCYHGSLGTWYDTERLLKFIKAIRSRGYNFTAFVNDPLDESARRLLEAGASVLSVAHSDMPSLLQSMDGSVFFIRATPSKIASMPTKLGESLAVGLPVLTASGVGDVDEILEENQVGLVLDGQDEIEVREVLNDFVEMIQEPAIKVRCRQVAERHFSLYRGVETYDRVYRQLIETGH